MSRSTQVALDATAFEKLQRYLQYETNCLVCGGNAQRRRRVVDKAARGFKRQGGGVVLPTPDVQVGDKLEALGKRRGRFLVIFHDAQRIPARLLWVIRSVAQTQRNVVYIFEGAGRNHMLDMVVKYDAAFYRQLVVVDLNPPKPRPTRSASRL